ncbi:MAG: hypothetical protein HFI65_08520 [Lachnospiraceae bacterium]|nr:hypothetical protein [Lachnospiraceae bacterium]
MVEMIILIILYMVLGGGISLLTAFLITRLVKCGKRRAVIRLMKRGENRDGNQGGTVYWILFGLFVVLAAAMLTLEYTYFYSLGFLQP